MPKKKNRDERAEGALEAKSLPAGLVDQLVTGPMTAEDVNAMFRQLKKAVLEKALGAELTHHLGYEKAAARGSPRGNHRNGTTAKTVLTDEGPLPIETPRDRAGTFEPLLIGKHERRFTGFDDKIIGLYARGMSVREIQGHLLDLYAVEVSPQLISTVTDAVLSEVTEWQVRPLERLYPVVFFDALRVKIRDEGVVRNKAVYLAIGVLPDGRRDVLGLWIEHTEGAKFWLKVFNDLRTRGVEDVLIAVVDGLKGFPEAIEAVFPKTTVQTCVVHLIRNSLEVVSYKDRKAVAAALRPIYTALNDEVAALALDEFAASPWGQRYPTIVAAWRRVWTRVIPFFAFPPDIRRILYTTNAIESLHMQLRKIIKTRGHFPSDEAATKLIWLALRNIIHKWGIARTTYWKVALNQFAILYADRFQPIAVDSTAQHTEI
jgi:putative transposase